MYNGIGLSTVRGSATSGHVTKNMSYLKPEFFRNKLDSNQSGGRFGDARKGKDGANYKVNKEVIEHNKKHALEAKIYEFEDSLREGGGLTEDAIEEKVAAYRKKLNDEGTRTAQRNNEGRVHGRGTDTHEISARKNEENERLRAAFGIGANFVSGSSFDPAAQEQRRKERDEEKAARFEQNKIDRQRRDQEREQRQQAQAQRLADRGDGKTAVDRPPVEGGRGRERPTREKYIPKDRSGEALRERSRSRSQNDRKRGRERSRSPDSRGGGRARGRSDSRDRGMGRRQRPRSSSRSPSASRAVHGGTLEAAEPTEGANPRGKESRARSRSRSSSSGSRRSSSSGSSRTSGSSSSSGSSSGSERGGSRSSSRNSRTPQRRSPSKSPPRRKTRWGEK